MAWNPNIPTVTNRVQDDLDAIRENFQHLDPLAPYIQAILDSRIVDHNLDVANPPSGYYVRWENGYQICTRTMTPPAGQLFENLSERTVEGSIVRTSVAEMSFPADFFTVFSALTVGGRYHSTRTAWLVPTSLVSWRFYILHDGLDAGISVRVAGWAVGLWKESAL